MVTVQCSRPDEIKLNVCVELTIGEWKKIISIIQEGKYYGPLSDMMLAIRIGVENVQQRETVNIEAGK